MKPLITLAAVAALVSPPALADESDWVAVADASTMSYAAQRNSMIYTPKAISFVMRSVTKADGSVDVFRAAVTRADCAARAGVVVFFSLDFSKERFRSDFALGAGNIAASIARTLCEQQQFERQKEDRAPVSRVL